MCLRTSSRNVALKMTAEISCHSEILIQMISTLSSVSMRSLKLATTFALLWFTSLTSLTEVIYHFKRRRCLTVIFKMYESLSKPTVVSTTTWRVAKPVLLLTERNSSRWCLFKNLSRTLKDCLTARLLVALLTTKKYLNFCEHKIYFHRIWTSRMKYSRKRVSLHQTSIWWTSQ